MTNEEINKIKVAKVKCLKSTLFFTRYFFKNLNNRKFSVNSHHEEICAALDRVYSGQCKRLIINIAPRYGKTELAVKNFIARGLALNPSAKFIHLSYSDSLALTNSEETKDIIDLESYQSMFPEVRLRKDATAKKKWTTEQRGGLYATSSSGQVTGFGAGAVDLDDVTLEQELDSIDSQQQFGGAIVIDDPIKPDDTDSDILRDKVNKKFETTIRNRVNSRNTPIIVIMQRLHPNDLCGYLLDIEPEDWEVLSFPCIDEEGLALWPEKHTLEELLKIKRNDPVTFERQYLQNPKPSEGLVFPEEQLKRFRLKDIEGEEGEGVIAYVDSADEGKDSFCCVVGKIVEQGFYIIDVIFSKDNLDFTYPRTVDLSKKLKIDYLRIETNSQGAPIYRKLHEDLDHTQVNPIFNVKNKNTRILVQSGFVKNYFYFRADIEEHLEYQKYFKELTNFTKTSEAKHDDSPDATAGLSLFVRQMFPEHYE
jgi:predicted phage terminase large subunit-like protein